MKTSPFNPIAKICTDFLYENIKADAIDVVNVQEHIVTSLGGLFNTTLATLCNDKKEFILSDENGFKKEIAAAILFRINLVENRQEFLNLLFKELIVHSKNGLTDEKNWSLVQKNNSLVLINIRPEKEIIPPVERKRATVFRFGTKK